MFPLPQQLLTALENSPEVADFFNAITSQSFVDNLFHSLLVDLQSGDLFTVASHEPNLGSINVAPLATYNSAPLSGEHCLEPRDYASRSAFLDYCSENLSSVLERFQEYQNEQTL